MANCLLAPINWAAMAGVAWSGGDWAPSLPLANLASTDTLAVARSATAAAGDTVIAVDLGAQRLWDVLCLAWANLSPDAAVRVTSDEGYDSGWVAAYPVTHVPVAGRLPFGRPAADGRMPADERDPRGVSWLLALPAAVTASALTVAIADEGNPDGYLQAGCLWVAKAERPAIGLQDGLAVTAVEESTARRSLGGTLIGRRLWRRRRIAAALRWQDRDVALGTWFETARMAGRTRPLLFAVEGEGVHGGRLAMIGHLDEATPIEHAAWRHWGWPFAITEA
ncbi:MAG: hypothetical protein AB7P02_03460 [Alphaproteobacteria bacterium]